VIRLRRAWARLLGTFLSTRREGELAEEIETHLQLQTEDNVRLGLPPQEARRQAHLRLGGIESIKESYRDQRGLPVLASFARDVRYAIRGMRKSPAFTAAAVLSLALGIALNCAIFSLANVVVFGSMPYRDPGRLVVIWQTLKRNGNSELQDPSVADIVDWEKSVADGGWCGDRAGGGVRVGALCAVAVIRRHSEGSDGIRSGIVGTGCGRNDVGIHTGAAGGED